MSYSVYRTSKKGVFHRSISEVAHFLQTATNIKSQFYIRGNTSKQSIGFTETFFRSSFFSDAFQMYILHNICHYFTAAPRNLMSEKVARMVILHPVISLGGGRRALKKFLAGTSSPLDTLVKVRLQFSSPFRSYRELVRAFPLSQRAVLVRVA